MTSRHLITTTICFVFTLFGLLSFLAATEQQRLQRAQQIRSGQNIELGAKLYSANCRTCHGLRGEGIGQLGPPLSDAHFFTSRLKEVGWQSTLEDYINATTEHGRMMGTRPIYAGNGSTAVMSPWHQKFGGPLRGDEIHTITAFILNWEQTARGEVELVELEVPQSSFQDPEVVERGAAVFAATCSKCHRYGEIGAPETPGPDLTGIMEVAGLRRDGMESPDYLRESVLIPAAFVADDYSQIPAENSCGAVLTESELTAVIGFLMH